MYDNAEEVLDRYIELEKRTLKKINAKEDSDIIGSTSWKMKGIYEDRLQLLEWIKEDICG